MGAWGWPDQNKGKAQLQPCPALRGQAAAGALGPPVQGAQFYSRLGFYHFRLFFFFIIILFLDLFVPLDMEICRKKTLGVTCNLVEP